ncbi:MAG: hypothetical protein ACUVT0_09130 [Thermochromatium sp.]
MRRPCRNRSIAPGAYDGLPYTARVLAENLVRRCDPAILSDSLRQIVERQARARFPLVPGARGLP